MLWLEGLNVVLLQYLGLNRLATLLHESLPLSPLREWTHMPSHRLIRGSRRIDQFQCRIVIQVHSCCYYAGGNIHRALGTEDRILLGL